MARTTMKGDLIRGALAGAAAVYALDRLDWYMFRRQGAAAQAQTVRARPDGLDPAHVIANRAASAVGVHLAPQQPNPAGIAVHYALGGMMGMLYSVFRSRLNFVGAGLGVPFGISMFLLQDEGMNTLLKTAGRPKDYPWQDHARGFVAHGFFGLVTDVLLRLLPGSSRPRWRSPRSDP